MWLFTGIAYHWLHFVRINPLADIFSATLDPAIIEALLQGEQAHALRLKDFAGAIPLLWSEQRASVFQTG